MIAGEVEALQLQAQNAVADRLPSERLLPILAQLGRSAPAGSVAWIFAHRALANEIVTADPRALSPRERFGPAVSLIRPLLFVFAVDGDEASVLAVADHAVSAMFTEFTVAAVVWVVPFTALVVWFAL